MDKYSVLVVDNDKTNIISLTHILSPEYTIYAAKNGRVGIELAIHYLPDVILLDILMPEIDGYEVLSLLKNYDITRHIPIIFLTGLNKTDNEERGLALGASDYITKPFSSAVVKLRIKNQIKIIEQRITEKELWQVNAENKAKSEILSNMSHEMRTPMNAIIGMTNIAIKSDDTDQKNQALKKIGDASAHLLSIINDVLDMAKIDTNRLELVPMEFNFGRMLQTVTESIIFLADEKQQQITMNIDTAIPYFLMGDDQRLAQVVHNLLSNAVKFSPRGGNICLEASFVGETDGNCELRIEVSDNGIGISNEQQEKLFHAFTQAQSGKSREYSGAGLGLVISRNIIELMGGRIWVESEPGKGSRFIFTVKVQRGKNDPVSHGVEFTGKNLLVVDDIEINREIFMALLEGTGVLIDCAENGIEALDLITREPEKYDMVFMDIQMPKMDGIEATRRIRAIEAAFSKDIPIIAMTANVNKDDKDACYEAGMNGHIGKPLEIDLVLETLRKYLC
ncbi:MAG: response regulator [Treponema sp.]|nr:response regulator [Treponema sp.]